MGCHHIEQTVQKVGKPVFDPKDRAVKVQESLGLGASKAFSNPKKMMDENILSIHVKMVESQIHSTANTIGNRVSTVKIIDCLTSLTL